MKKYKSHWWSIRLPKGWTFEEDDICATFTAPPGSGALQISAARNSNGDATNDDLRDFAKNHIEAGAPLRPISFDKFTGFYLHFADDDLYQRQWWLRYLDTVVFATYTCKLNAKGKEDALVDGILDTLQRID